MATYEPPVSHLVKLGRPDLSKEWADYSSHGIGPEHIPELIRLLQDEELASADPDLPEVYAQIHAWRALGQLRAEAAIEPMLDILAAQDEDDWSDWVTEEVPRVLGLIGPAALPATLPRLEQRGRKRFVPTYFAEALSQIAQRHPETRTGVVNELARVLGTAAVNDPTLNGFVISNLIDLKATEAWPAIEAAFATGNVDESIAGDAADVKWRLGLGPEPTGPRRFRSFTRSASGRTPKQRAEDRARQRKAEKRRQKRKRK
jgi:HEAT repeat protein